MVIIGDMLCFSFQFSQVPKKNKTENADVSTCSVRHYINPVSLSLRMTVAQTSGVPMA